MSKPIHDALKFVQGSVSKKDLIPGMTHFAIEKGTVRGYNGVIALSTPIPFDIDCKPKALQLVPAIAHCDEQVVISITEKGRLRIQSGTYRAFIDCVQEETPHVMPEGERMEFDGEALLKGLKVIDRFIGNDASRRWQTGVLLRGKSAYATCNVILVEYWLGAEVPVTVNIPEIAIKEMLRINLPPTYAQVDSQSITFHYTNGSWLRSQLLEINWPDLQPILDMPNNALPLDDSLFLGLEKLKPFCDKAGRVYFKNGVISTSTESDAEGAAIEVPGFEDGIYNIEMLNLLRGVATHIDFHGYPNPCTFYGDRLRGAIIGMRKVI